MSANHPNTVAPAPRPVYVEHLPPCNCACPAGENIQEWLYLAQAERYEEAWRALTRDNPMPAIHGRVCYHPCEDVCNRKQYDQPVSVHAVERFLGDLAISKGWSFAPVAASGKRVLVIGSGPCGLSAAYHLARLGHHVTVHEAGSRLGGMMRYGIPGYRLPRDVLDAEIDRIARMGVDFKTGARADNLDAFIVKGKYDAVLLAIGAQLGKRVDIPSTDAGKILDALRFLADADNGASLCLGRRVAVYGGGNTAMDAARTALRLGARESIIIYRRDRSKMPAHESELEEAMLEGVVVNWLRTIKQVGDGDIEVEVMQLDARGIPQPTGKKETLHADVLILALGQETQSKFLQGVSGIVVGRDGTIEVDDQLMTGHRGIFAGGDMIPAEKTVTTAVGHGKKAARCIDAYLRGKTYLPAPKHTPARLDQLNTDWYARVARALQPQLDLARRLRSFDETVGGLDSFAALEEAHRCLSCGNCFECDTCYNVCPDQAITKLGPGKRYTIDMSYCSRCGLCARECPCGAIEMTAAQAAAAPALGR
jgi:NADPH-dependent glutamate synthase beta subunit-like oxidoreductase